METTNLILIEHFCIQCEVEMSFIHALHEYGIVEIIVLDDKKYIADEQLKKVERAIHFHNELNINLEGIEVIHHLLKQIEDLQEKLRVSYNKLDLFNEII